MSSPVVKVFPSSKAYKSWNISTFKVPLIKKDSQLQEDTIQQLLKSVVDVKVPDELKASGDVFLSTTWRRSANILSVVIYPILFIVGICSVVYMMRTHGSRMANSILKRVQSIQRDEMMNGEIIMVEEGKL